MVPLATQAPAPVRTGSWAWLPKPLFTAWLLGCVVSLLDSRSLALTRVLPAVVTWSWVPLFEILALGAAWKISPRPMPFARGVDRFCAGNAPWWILLIAFGAGSRLFPVTVWLVFAAATATWCARTDYFFFRRALGSASPWRDLVIERAAAWIPGILLFGGGSLWPGLLEKLK